MRIGKNGAAVTTANIYRRDSKRLRSYLADNDLDNQQDGIKQMLDELKVKYPSKRARVKA